MAQKIESRNLLIRDPQQKLLDLLQQISLAVAKAETSDIAFQQVLALICEYMAWPLGHLYVWSEETETLVSSGIWFGADDERFDAFRVLSEHTHFTSGDGTVGRVISTREAVTVADVREDAGFVRQLPIKEGGIRGYFAFPVVTGDQVFAVLEFFSPCTGLPDKDLTSVINHASALLGLTIERERVLTRLRQSEERLAEAQRIAHFAHWEWDITRDELTWSSEMYCIYGLEKKTFQPSYEGVLSYIHPQDLDYVKKKLGDILQEGQPFNFFYRIIRPNGGVRIVHTRGQVVQDQAGQITKLYGTTQDLTELKDTENKLAERVRQLTALIKIGRTVAGTLELPAIYDSVLKLIRPLIEAEALVLVLYEKDELKIAAIEQVGVLDIIGARIPLDGSIAGDSWRDRKSISLRGEACRQRLFLALPETAEFHPTALMATPLCIHEDCLGVLVAAHSEENAFNDEDMLLLETTALWTAIAISNARQYEALRRKLDETKAIVAISDALVEAMDLDQVLQLISESVMEILDHADWTAIHLLGVDGERLELAASAGLQIGQGDYTIAPGEGIAQRVIATGETINIPDVQKDPDRLPIDQTIQARSLLVSLVESRQRRLGTISVQCAMPDAFSSEDERLLKILGIQAGVAIDSARLYAAQRQALKRAEQQSSRIRKMARRIVQAQEEERARISRELHDEAGQSLTALQIGLELAQAELPDELAEVRTTLTDLVQLANDTQANLRNLSHNLRPSGLDAYGLDAALRGLCDDFARHTGLDVSYEGKKVPDLQPVLALSLYRFAQEALTNVVKHANANSVQVILEPRLDKISLQVIDDGKGFTPPNWEANILPQGTGLVGMLERLEMVDGNIDIDSVEGSGTRLMAIAPLEIDSP
jgi:PAS domain S-box-containing protein